MKPSPPPIRRADALCVAAIALSVCCVTMTAAGCSDDTTDPNTQQRIDTGDLQGDYAQGDGTPWDGIDAALDDADSADQLVDVGPPRPDDTACNASARAATCASPLLNDGAAPPTDPSDLLYYVNRWHSIPADYPISATSTWNPCFGGDPGVPHDLVCLPDAYTNAPTQALRQVAWSSPAPPAITTTHDGLPVGHEGTIGYKAMMDAARAEAGFELFVVSGFRSFATQEATYNAHVSREVNQNGHALEEARMIASTYSAQPGHSEHQLAVTADLTYRTEVGYIYPYLEQEMGQSAAFGWVMDNAHRFGIVLTYGRTKVEVTQYVYEPWHYRFVGVEAADAMHRCDLNTEEFLAARYGVDPLPPYAGESITLVRDAQLVAHIETLPGSWFTPGEAFTKTWRVHNPGTVNWHGFRLQHVDGASFGGAELDIACVLSGETVDLSVELTSPATSGEAAGDWRVADAVGTSFGDLLPVRVVVSTTEPASEPYTFVRIDDLSSATGGADPGADLDAVVMTAPSGAQSYAARVDTYVAAPADVRANDPGAILGAPDAFASYPDVSTCSVDGGFVSLGGGGTIVVEMGDEILEGNALEVLEIGGCTYDGVSSAIADEVRVQVSVSPDVLGQWVTLGGGTGPSVAFNIPPLPPMQ